VADRRLPLTLTAVCIKSGSLAKSHKPLVRTTTHFFLAGGG